MCPSCKPSTKPPSSASVGGNMPKKTIALDEVSALPQMDSVDELLSKLQELNGSAGNKALREKLDWNEEKYWEVHSRAVDLGKIVRGRGKGGSVSIAGDGSDEVAELEVESSLVAEQVRERDLYDPARDIIRKSWSKSQGFDEFVVEVTADKGRAKTGGKWTRPDVALLGMRAFPFLPGRYFDIVTFEIKPEGKFDVEGVFEALSHKAFASKSYVIYKVTDKELDNGLLTSDVVSRVLEIATHYGVGVIVASDVGDWDTWDERVSASRGDPSPEQANRFIATCFSKEVHDNVIKWHK